MCFSATASFASGGILLFLGLCSVGLVLLIFPCWQRQTTTGSNSNNIMTIQQRLSLCTVAAIPLFFGLHQISEGLVWNDLHDDTLDNELATRCFAYTAYIFWPLYIPVAFAVVEWTRRRQQQQPSSLNSTTSTTSGPQHNSWSTWPSLLCCSVKTRQRILAFHVLLAIALVVYVLRDMIRTDPNTVIVDDGNNRLQYEGWGLDNQTLSIFGSIVYVYCVVGTMVVSSLPYSTIFGLLIAVSLIITLILWQNQFPSTWCFFSALISAMVIFIVYCELQLYQTQQQEQQDQEPSSSSLSQLHDEHHQQPVKNKSHRALTKQQPQPVTSISRDHPQNAVDCDDNDDDDLPV